MIEEIFIEHNNKLNFTKICRICLLEQENMQSLNNEILLERLINCTASQVSLDDGLPQSLCSNCVESLDNCYNFKQKVKTSYKILVDYLKNKNTIESDVQFDGLDETIEKKLPQVKKRKKNKQTIEMKKALSKLLASAPKTMQENNSKTCHICKKEFSCKAKLTRHYKTHTGIKSYACKICNKTYMESGALQKHFLAKHSGRDKPYKCTQCEQSFDLRSTLTRHTRTHTGEKPFGCDVCHKFYPSKSYLNKHRKTHFNEKIKPFVCEICNKTFAVKDGLKAHLITHSNKRLFQCNMCDKSFATNGSLKSHTKHIHTKEKNFMCQICAKTFITKCELNSHIRRHTGEKKEPSHQCKMCDKKLSSSTHLKLHVRSEHTGERPYTCEYCNKTFITLQVLKIHKRYHTGERPFICSFCEKGFVTNETLKVHIRVHTGERPFICNICGASFAQSGTLKTHMKSH